MLTNAGIGEAVVTVMNENGAPTPVALTRLRAPGSVMGPSADATVTSVIAASALLPTYGTAVDPVSAFEKLQAAAVPAETPLPPSTGPAVGTPLPRPPAPAPLPSPTYDGGIASDVIGALGGAFGSGLTGGLKSAARSVGRSLIRDIFGTAPRKRRR